MSISMAVDRLPETLRALDQWVVWRQAERSGRSTKVPYDAKNGRNARTDQPSTWSPLAVALQVLEKGSFSGIGFVLTSTDGMTGIDLDHALDSNGEMKDWAKAVLDDLPEGAYVEISPSGRGLHALVRARKPGKRCKAKVGDGAIEIYDQGRYLTVTGHVLPTSGREIVEAQQAIETIYRKLFEAKSAETDQELLDRAFTSKNGGQIRALWNGSIDGHASHSEADLALCSHLAFWTDGDEARVDRLFRQSGLMREKWERADYRKATLAKALSRLQRSPRTSSQPSGPESYWQLDPLDEPQKPNTHKANAWRLAQRHGRTLRYASGLGFLYFDGRRWVQSDQEAQKLAARVSRYVCEEAEEISRQAKRIEDKKTREGFERRAETLQSWARTSEQGNAIRETLHLSKPYLQLDPEVLDAHPFLLNVDNGTLDLQAGRLKPHDAGDLLTKITPVAYRPEAKAPGWEQFIHDIMGGRKRLIRYLQTALGYCLTGTVREQCLFFAHGFGRNGKSTLFDILRAVLGSDYVTKAAPDLLMASQFDRLHNAEIADLRGARLVISQEVSQGRSFDVQKTKELTGERYLKTRRLYGNWFEFQATFKIWLVANHRPQVRDTTRAFWRRVHLIPFTYTIARPDPDFAAKLASETSGILNWLLAGCRRYLTEGLQIPPEVLKAVEEYRLESDSLKRFLDECCVIGKDQKVQASLFWRTYDAFCRDQDLPRIRRSELRLEWLSRGFPAPVRRKQGIFYLGLALGKG